MPQSTIDEAFRLALQHHQAGRLPQAENLYRQILGRQAGHVDALHNLGVLANQVGRNDVAVALLRQAVALRPNSAEGHSNLGVALAALGHSQEAIACFRQSIALRPDAYETYSNLGNALHQMGRLEEAITVCRQAISLGSGNPGTYSNLGVLLHETGRWDEAIAAYRQALAIDPNFPDACSNLGNALRDKGQLEEAVAVCRRAIESKPGFPEAHNNLGNALSDLGRFDEAIAASRRAVELRPNYPEALSNLGNALKEKGLLDEAVAAYRQAITLRPGFPEAHSNLGNVLRELHRLDEAIASCRAALALRPNYPEAWNNLGVALTAKGELDEAAAACRQAIVCRPNFSEAHTNLANVFKDQGALDEAIAAYRQAVALRPDLAGTHSNLVYTLHFHSGCDPRAIAREQQHWNRAHADPVRQFIRPHANDPNPDRRLRIGYVSPDFRDHVVGRNLLPLFRHHDRSRFEVFCYAQTGCADAVTSQFQQYSDRWRSIMGVGDEQAAEQIRRDGIDILVDLTLHMAHNRLPLFARKPAPVQASFAGYPGGTGLDAIEYRLSDPYLDPVDPGPESSDGHSSFPGERVVRLPDSFWCYDPIGCGDIAVNSLPAVKNGVITFGCLNNFCKINEPTLDLWARVLGRAEGSRLLMLAHPGSHRRRTIEHLGKHGIDPARVEFVPQQSRHDYLREYHRIDIGLDSFPYNGHTTSLESFWMGVPVVTLVGQSPVSRAGWCQLSNLKLTELAGKTPEEFVRIAVELAEDLPRLGELRSTLRRRMEQSPLMDAPRFARNIESAYRQMWRSWCERQSPNR